MPPVIPGKETGVGNKRRFLCPHLNGAQRSKAIMTEWTKRVPGDAAVVPDLMHATVTWDLGILVYQAFPVIPMHWSIRATPAQEASLRLRWEDQEQVRAFQREEHKERSSGRWRTREEKVSWGGSPGSHHKGLVCRWRAGRHCRTQSQLPLQSDDSGKLLLPLHASVSPST